MHKISAFIESLTNSLTMYLVAVFALLAIAGTSLLLSSAGILGFSLTALLATLLVLLASSYLSSRLFAWTFSTQHNRASGLITSLILYLTLAPGDTAIELFKIALVGCLASASKYLLAWRGRHIFNPAAAALMLGSVLGLAPALWWVATPLLLPVVLVAGLCIVTKTRRYVMVSTFVATALIVSMIVAAANSYPITEAIRLDIVSGPLAFFTAVMLTEPLTSPGTRRHQAIYASLTGILYSAQLPWLSTPQGALLMGNLYTFFAARQQQALSLRIKAVRTLAPHAYEVEAVPLEAPHFSPGQYVELQLPHSHQDSRGTRRILSIASAPDEPTLRFTTRLPAHRPSSFKQALVKLKPDTVLRANYTGGDFTLPRDTTIPLVWIAGGIGITPFRAMTASLLAASERRDVTLLYSVRSSKDLIYLDYFHKAAKSLPLKIIPIVTHPEVTWHGEQGAISNSILSRHVTDISRCHVYISGPPAMVEATRNIINAPRSRPARIVTDHFSGY